VGVSDDVPADDTPAGDAMPADEYAPADAAGQVRKAT
jgi:hypothetical protein